MKRIKKYLPTNCYSPNQMKSIEGIVIHFFSGRYQFPDDMFNSAKCYNLFKDLNLPVEKREHFKMEDAPKRMYASAHFMIDRDGVVVDLVPIPNKAWHAGKSSWNGRDDCNQWMLGIEMVATDDSGFTDAQYESLIELTKELLAAHKDITWDNITGHENIAPGRKTDPGKLFDWDRYRAMGNTDEAPGLVDIIKDILDD